MTYDEPTPRSFQAVVMRRCSLCPKPATHQILGHPGNVNFGYACAQHVKAKVRGLEQAHKVRSGGAER